MSADERTEPGTTEPVPCDHLSESFFHPGRCVNCGLPSILHTPEGWAERHEMDARACAMSAKSHEQEASRLRDWQAIYEARAANPPTYTPQCRQGFWPTNGGTSGDSTTCARCGREKDDPVHNDEGLRPYQSGSSRGEDA